MTETREDDGTTMSAAHVLATPIPTWQKDWREFQDPLLLDEGMKMPSIFETYVAGHNAGRRSVLPDRETLADMMFVWIDAHDRLDGSWSTYDLADAVLALMEVTP